MSDVILKMGEIKDLLVKKFMEVGVKSEEAKIVSDVLTHADARGVRSHGSMRVEHYVNRIKSGGINLDVDLVIEKTAPNCSVIDSKGGFGHVGMYTATNEAIKNVKENGGMHAVLVKNSSHCGALSYYASMAIEAGCVAMVYTNTDKCVVPFGSANAYFGTNPMAFGFPGNKHRILIDMATSEVALGKVLAAREAGKEIPSTWGVDENGSPTTDPHKVKYLTPFGGYKGTALATIVEGFSGFFTGAFGPHITTMYGDLDKLRNVSGMIFIMAANAFGSGNVYRESVDKMFEEIKASKTAPGVSEVFIPGEIEDTNYAKSVANGAPVYENVYAFLNS